MSNRRTTPQITPGMLLRAYAIGIFPMAESRDDPDLYWIDPERRGILPLDTFHVARSLRRRLRQSPFETRIDFDFAATVEACAEPTADRPDSWINEEIRRLSQALHEQGFAHSVETWLDGQLVGGLYGVALGGAFFGESMFSRVTDASKVALAHLVARLRLGGFRVLDTQFVTEHLQQFGAVEISRAQYHRRLTAALQVKAYLPREPLAGAAVVSVLQSSTPTS